MVIIIIATISIKVIVIVMVRNKKIIIKQLSIKNFFAMNMQI
jgi:hypothetical protein